MYLVWTGSANPRKVVRLLRGCVCSCVCARVRVFYVCVHCACTSAMQAQSSLCPCCDVLVIPVRLQFPTTRGFEASVSCCSSCASGPSAAAPRAGTLHSKVSQAATRRPPGCFHPRVLGKDRVQACSGGDGREARVRELKGGGPFVWLELKGALGTWPHGPLLGWPSP